VRWASSLPDGVQDFQFKHNFLPSDKVLDERWDKNHDSNFFGALGRSGNSF
jgi:hypothetical protein